MFLINLFLRWLTPYKYTEDVVNKKRKRVINKKQRVLTAEEMLMHGVIGVRIIDVGSQFYQESALEKLLNVKEDVAFFYHDKNRHQLIIRFKPNSAYRYQARSDSKRRGLKPMLRPIKKSGWDRTHLVPIGFHGTESDNRLLVGWDSVQNRVDINRFERKVRKLNDTQTILWFADIRKEKDGSATWDAYIFNEMGKKLLEDTWHDKSKFTWQ